jgi:methionyl-tRNA formyltransferase
MQKNNIKFAFFGTPEISAKTLDILKGEGFAPSVIITSPDKPKGRKMTVTPPPVKVWAQENDIPVLQPDKLKELESLKDFQFDVFIVVAYGKIFPEWLINMPKLRTLNIHYSLLPKYRGASPVQSAILNGETETGVTIQKMAKELDAGPIIAQEKTEIGPDEKTPELLERLAEIGGKLLAKTLPDYALDKIKAREQDGSQATLAGKISKADGELDLNADAMKNYNKFRAFYEWPRTYYFKDGKRIIITDAAIEVGKLKIKKILPEGGKEISLV